MSQQMQEWCTSTFYNILDSIPISSIFHKVQCKNKGTHTNNERERILVAIQYVFAHNKGYISMDKLRKRLKQKGFKKILIINVTNEIDVQDNMCNFDIKTGHHSVWKVNYKQYCIMTNLELK
eukprot:367813_1